ncbi:SRPBCC family protein [Actinomadura fibrosa]|uniref:SRPBCC family protein n=1 Tax=Actinomadura fibrosa TaxID=111802 RepID=A0ABW2XCI0_9ACTN|nr:SRPBCC family protein [Actinomadura fibrosa]
MSARRRLTGRLRVALPPEEAFGLFTPRGEERWVPGWRPRFPAGDDGGPGTVFETVHDGETTTWVVLVHEPGRRLSYARVTPGHRAGTVTVVLTGDGDGGSDVEVSYDLTALTADAERALDGFAAGYPAFLRSWEGAIQSTRSTSSPPSA